ncbi:retrovirus-related pol polyprotein from transposon TNT 1-94 [Tanacetum coccineum]
MLRSEDIHKWLTPVTPQSESVSKEDSDPEQAQRDKDIQKNLALLAKYFRSLYKPTNNNLRTSSNSRNKTEDTTPSPVVQQTGIQCFNCNGFGHYAKECRKPKRVKDYSYHKEKMMMCKQVEQGVPLQGEQADWLADMDEEIDEQELEAHYSFMAKIQEVLQEESSSTEQPLEQRAALTNLIVNLTLNTEENKMILKQLKKANASLTQELEECKTNLDETSRALGEATSCRDSCLIALQNKQNELEKYIAFNDRTIDYDILQTKLNETLGLLARKDIDIKEGLKTKAYEISVVNQKHDELVKRSLLTKSQFEGQLKEKSKVISDLKVKEEKDIDKMIEMDKQLKFLNEIVYTRNQSIQTIHMLAPKCSTYNGRPTFANPRYLKKAQSEKPCLYEIPYDTSDLANRFGPNREETMTLANESRSKLNKDYVKPYDYTKQNSLYEIFKAPSLEYLYQLERAKEVRKTMWRKPFVRTKPNIAKNVAFLPVSKSISKSRQVFNDMTFNINQFREIVDQAWFKHTSDYFRVPTAKDMEVLIKTLLMPLSIKTQNDSFRFEHELKTEMHEDYEYVKSLEKEVDELESEKADFSNIYDLLLEECVSKDVTCSYLHSLSDLNAYAELQCLYLHKVKECECLAQKLSKQTESVNKEVHNKLLKSFAKLENHSISLELALQQCKEQMKNNSVCKENGSNVFRKEREQYHEIQDLKAQMQDKNIAISELKKLIEKCKGKSVETQFDKPSVVRQPNAQRIPKPSVLGKPTPFSNSPEMRSFQTKQSVNKTNVSDGMYRISTTTTQSRTPQLPHASRNTNPHVSKSTGVNHYTSVSRPQLKCYQVKDKVEASITIFSLLVNSVECGFEVAFRKSTCFCESSSGRKLIYLTGNRVSDLPPISLQETTSSTPNLVSWLKLHQLKHGLPKLKYVKDQICSSCEMSKAKRSSFKSKAVPSSKGRLNLLHMDLCGPMRCPLLTDARVLEQDTYVYFKEKALSSDFHSSKLNRTALSKDETALLLRLLEQCSQLLSFHYHFLAEAVATASNGFTQNKMEENLFGYDEEKVDPCVMVGYYTQSKGYRVYNKRTRLIVESIHIKFDEIKEMMSDHNSSDLAPQRQEMSVENVSSGLVSQGQKASDYDNSDPVPPRKNVVPRAEKTDLSHQGLEFLFSPLIEEYYTPSHNQAEENNNDQAPNALFQEDEFINPFCTRVQEISESSSRNIDNTDVHSFQPQSHDTVDQRHPLETLSSWKSNPCQFKQTTVATDPKCDELHQFDRLKV